MGTGFDCAFIVHFDEINMRDMCDCVTMCYELHDIIYIYIYDKWYMEH